MDSPEKSSKDIDETIDFSIKLNADYSQFSILTPFPGTPIYHELKEKNLIATEDWERYTVLNPILKYEDIGLSKTMVERKLAKAYIKFYTRPRYLLEHRHIVKTIFNVILRTFILPKIRGNTGKGWYQNLP